MVNSAEIVSFSFPKFVPGQPNLLLQRDALITSTGRLQPTKVDAGKPVKGSVGRALYSAPIHIWDSNTGNTADFVTSFSFVITAPTSTPADGIAFFLAPVNSQPPTTGGLLGLFPKEDHSASYKTVAVEFDTFRNQGWDPAAPHIGIDVNSIQSTKTTPWALESGKVANVTIRYEASTGTLTASLVYPSSAASYIVSGTVDLKDVLDEYVSVGLSASTGEYSEINEVLSWSFKSELP